MGFYSLASKKFKLKICNNIYLSMIDEKLFTACNCLYHALYAKSGPY